ncbi:MAG: glycine--tRNA ligase subunit beta [Sterolibacterium sp.]
MSATLLVELLTEELPPKSLAKLGQVFKDEVFNGLVRHQLTQRTPDNATWFATPRRLAVLVRDVAAIAEDRREEKKIMPVAVALDAAGKPTPALLKKLEANGIAASELNKFEKRLDGKSDTFFYTAQVKGAQLNEVLAGIVAEALKKLPVAKVMRWGAGEAQFVRPVHGLVMLHGSSVVPGEVLGLPSGRATRGHRFMGTGSAIEIGKADDYETLLEGQGKVIASFARRRDMIRSQLNAAAGQRQWLQDEALIDEVTALVEFPAVYEASFETEFLQVPQECLILTMKANQKYFPLFERDKLTNRFLLVSNMQVADPGNIVGGNARVVRPRLADAKFFYDQDRKTPLARRVDKLASVVYHNKLGSQGQRVERLSKLARLIAQKLHADVDQAARAALLAKADLVTDMVGEFPELQGIMGRYYAAHDGEPQAVADAIEAHYRPRFNGDTLPQGNIACAVALADKLDALIGFFGIGQVPTGDKDPFGLRRAALGVLRILMETPLPLDVESLIEDAAKGFGPGVLGGDCQAMLLDFMLERLRGMLRDLGHEPTNIEAVLALRPTRIDLVPPKLAAVAAFAALPEAQALASANKRIVNILKKTATVAAEADPALLQEPAEKALFEQVNAITPQIHSLLAGEDYEGALKALAGLRAAVDAFFDGVMVMAEEPLTRQNRLALLGQLAGLMNQVADISRLSL